MIIINYLLTLMESQTVLQHSPSKKNIMAPNCLGKIQVTGGREISSRLKLDWAIFFFSVFFLCLKQVPICFSWRMLQHCFAAKQNGNVLWTMM